MSSHCKSAAIALAAELVQQHHELKGRERVRVEGLLDAVDAELSLRRRLRDPGGVHEGVHARVGCRRAA